MTSVPLINWLFSAIVIKRKNYSLIQGKTASKMQMQEQSKVPFSGKNTVQLNLEKFYKFDKNTPSVPPTHQNILQLEATLNRNLFRPQINTLERLPKTALELISCFRKDFSTDILKQIWKRIREDEKFDLENAMLQNGLILDFTQHTALVISDKGIDCLNLRETFNQRETKIFHYSENELKSQLTLARANENYITYSNIKYNATLLEFLVYRLKEGESEEEKGHFTIAVVIPSQKDDGHWPLVIKNNVTQMLGILAPIS